MDKFYVLKHKNGKYYSDGEFIEPEKKFAQKLRLGQAKSIKQNKDRYTICFSSSKGSDITIEEV